MPQQWDTGYLLKTCWLPRHNGRSQIAPTDSIATHCRAGASPRPTVKEKTINFYKVPIGFGLALSANTAAMNRYTHLTEQQKQEILNKAHNVRSEREMYDLVASLANGPMV